MQIMRGLLRGGLLALALITFNFNLGHSSVPGAPDPYNDSDPQTNAYFNSAAISTSMLMDKMIEGHPLTDAEQNMYLMGMDYVSQLKFEEIAIDSLLGAMNLREKIPYLLGPDLDNEAILSSALQIIRTHYYTFPGLANQDDVETLESELELLKKMREAYSEDKILSSENRKIFDDVIEAVEDCINKALKNPYQRHTYVLGDKEFSPFSLGKSFSPARTKAHFGTLKPGAKITEEIAKFRDKIREHAVGQPELENALARLELKRLMGIDTDVPQKLWLMGLPGVGKDTYVDAFALALHPDDPMAHRKHVFAMDVCKGEQDRSTLFGAGRGYIGSQTLPKWIHFVVQHSGGKYQVAKDMAGYEYVKEGADPKVKYFAPDEGILFVNEFHDWDPQAANDLLKQVIEHGRIPLRSSGGGASAVSEMIVPIRIVVASNDGIDLLRERNFSQKEAPSFEKIIERWRRSSTDKETLRARILARGENLKKSGGVLRGRLSDEFMSRWADSELLLLRPLDRVSLLQIARLSVGHLHKIMKGFSRVMGGVVFKFKESAFEALVDHHTRTDDGARRLKGGIQSYFKDPIIDAVADGVIEPKDYSREFEVDFIMDSKSGDVVLSLSEGRYEEVHAFIVDKAKPKVNIFDPEFVKRFDDFEVAFNQKIFGAKELARDIRESLFLTEHYLHSESSKSARKFALLGLSSTGKTQTAKEITKFYFGTNEAMETIAFDNINDEEQLKHLIYGRENGDPSPFMEAFDRNNGKCLILLDEVANIRDPKVLKALYRILDEATVTGFNDGKPRNMEGVIFVLTGNAGQEAFTSIPRHLPSKVQRQAQLDIYERIQKNPHEKRALLEKHFPQALYNRIGNGNTHIMAPLSHEGLRALMHDKIASAMERLNLSLKMSGSQVVFDNQENYLKFIEAAEENYFDVWQQGRSVDDFATDLEKQLLFELSKMGVEGRGEIRFNFDRAIEILDEDKKRAELHYVLESDTGRHAFSMKGTNSEEKVVQTKHELLQTSIHEAGHEIARKALSDDYEKPVRISIIPGLTMIDGAYVYYAGIAVSEVLAHKAGTRQQFVHRLAKLYMGADAQRLVNQGAQADMGGSNDNMRADTYAAMALLAGGVDPAWGIEAPHQGETIENYLNRLSEDKKNKFEKAKDQIKKDAQALARRVLRSNIKQLMALGRELARKGEMTGEEIEAFYKTHPVDSYYSKGHMAHFWERWKQWTNWKSLLWNALPVHPQEPKMMKDYVADPAKAEVHMPDEVLQERKAAAVKDVEIPKSIQFKNCKALLGA